MGFFDKLASPFKGKAAREESKMGIDEFKRREEERLARQSLGMPSRQQSRSMHALEAQAAHGSFAPSPTSMTGGMAAPFAQPGLNPPAPPPINTSGRAGTLPSQSSLNATPQTATPFSPHTDSGAATAIDTPFSQPQVQGTTAHVPVPAPSTAPAAAVATASPAKPRSPFDKFKHAFKGAHAREQSAARAAAFGTPQQATNATAPLGPTTTTTTSIPPPQPSFRAQHPSPPPTVNPPNMGTTNVGPAGVPLSQTSFNAPHAAAPAAGAPQAGMAPSVGVGASSFSQPHVQGQAPAVLAAAAPSPAKSKSPFKKFKEGFKEAFNVPSRKPPSPRPPATSFAPQAHDPTAPARQGSLSGRSHSMVAAAAPLSTNLQRNSGSFSAPHHAPQALPSPRSAPTTTPLAQASPTRPYPGQVPQQVPLAPVGVGPTPQQLQLQQMPWLGQQQQQQQQGMQGVMQKPPRAPPSPRGQGPMQQGLSQRGGAGGTALEPVGSASSGISEPPMMPQPARPGPTPSGYGPSAGSSAAMQQPSPQATQAAQAQVRELQQKLAAMEREQAGMQEMRRQLASEQGAAVQWKERWNTQNFKLNLMVDMLALKLAETEYPQETPGASLGLLARPTTSPAKQAPVQWGIA